MPHAPTLRLFSLVLTTILLACPPLAAQLNTGGTHTTAHHSKQIIGYVPQYDAWKASNYGFSQQGVLNQLNLDYHKYTILNFSFFGVANDGSLHSADLRNQQIYQSGAIQSPGQLLMTDVYSSWDYWILFGQITPTWSVTADTIAQGYSAAGFGWKHDAQGIPETPFPIPLKNTAAGQPKGLIDLCHDNGIKCVASIGGWSMCKHFPEMAADPVKRARFLAGCQRLIAMGFDGIDIDWEYPGPYSGMNFTGSQADFANYTALMQQIRTTIGSTKLLTAAFAAQPPKLAGLDWPALAATMDYFNIMSYDFHGGWNDTAGHNSPLYPWPGQEGGASSWNDTLTGLAALGVPFSKINMGMAFYGRGVVTTGTGAVNAPTVKTARTVQPDGPITTAADFTHWTAAEGVPYHMHIMSHLTGWTQSWDDHAKVPYLTRSGAFLSYDNERSIGLKAKYIADHNLAGAIIWTAFGDLNIGAIDGGSTKLPRSSTTQSPLANTLNAVLAGAAVPNETTGYLATAAANATESAGTLTFTVSLSAAAATDVTVSYATTNGTAIAGSDYTAASGTLTFTPGQTRKTIPITLASDGTAEPLENLTLTLTNPSGAALAVTTATGTIIDGSPAPGTGPAPARGLSTLPANRPLTMGYLNALRSATGTEQSLSTTEIQTEIAGLHWGGYDVIVHAFAEPKADATLGETLGNFKAYQSPLLTEAHARNKTVLISIGGAYPAALSTQFATIAASSALRASFAANVVSYLKTHGYDGVDIDWEFPDVPAGKTNLNLLMQQLYAAVKAENPDYIVMFGTGPGWYMGSYDFATLKDHTDFFFYFGYDWKNPENGPMSKPGSGVQWTTANDTLPEQSVRGGLNYVLAKGFPSNKIICGLPFYGSANTSWSAVRGTYAASQATYDAAINSNTLEVQIGTEWFTSPTALKRKMDAVLKTGTSVLTAQTAIRGVGTWEIGHEHRTHPDLATAFEQWLAAYTGTPVLPTLSIATPAAITEGHTGSANLNFTVTLSPAATGSVTVNYATANGTAAAGSDFTATTGPLTFAAGETSKTIAVPILGDTTVEPNETFTLALTSPVNATLGTAAATGTITNDDVPPPGTEDDETTWTRHYTPPAAPGIAVTFAQPTSTWTGAFGGADITITNNGLALATWTLEFDTPWGNTGFWNAGTWTKSGSHHTLTQPTWGGYSLGTGGSIAIGFNGSGTWAMPTNILFNGQPIGGAPSNNTTLATWRSTHTFTGPNNTDTDGDALPDIIEFLAGTHPRQSTPAGGFCHAGFRTLTVNGVPGTYFCLEVSANPLAEAVEYRVETSTDLATWHAGANHFVRHSTATPATGNVTALWRAAQPSTPADARRFVRVSAREVVPGEVVPGGGSTGGGSTGGGTTGGGTSGPTGAPNVPTVSVQKDWNDNIGHTVTWNTWGGQPVTTWKVYQNGSLVHTAAITGSAPQTATWDFNLPTVGSFTYTVEVSNSIGAATSAATTYLSDGASAITLPAADSAAQVSQLTVNSGINTQTLQGGTAPYTVSTNHPAVLTASVTGSTLTLTGHSPGRSGLKITDATGKVRHLGVRVRHPDASLPGFPNYMAIGSVSEDAQADLDFWGTFNPGTRKNRWVDFRYIYINGGVKRKGTGWRTWTSVDGDRMRKFVRESIKFGMIPAIVWYNIPDGGESYTTDKEHMQDLDYMRGYYEDLKFALDIANEEAGDSPLLWILEPDLIGYMAQNNENPLTLMAHTGAAYDVGTLSTAAGDPLFPNTFRGMIESINYTIKKYSPASRLAWQFNLWAFPAGGWVAGSQVGVKGLMRVTDDRGMTTGRQIVWDEGSAVADYYMSCGILTHGAEYVSIDKYGLDGGAEQKNSNPVESTWFWNAEHWGNYLHYINALSTRTAKKVVLWQLPVGHINSSQLPNPYLTTPGVFPDHPNTPRDWEDSAPSFFFGDTFVPGAGNRYAWFTANRGNHATVSADGTSVTWGSHLAAARDAGAHIILFGDGVGNSTNGRGYNNTDDFWWITAAQKYYEAPVPLTP